jgi:predicted enzyme related to lactoylglutathione lyase
MSFMALLPALVPLSPALAGPEESANAFQGENVVLKQEVWRTVKAYTEASHQRDLEKYLSFWHPDFLGWHSGDANPTDHAARSNGLKYFFNATKSLEYDLEPVGIQIISNGDAAIVHYKLRNVLEIKETGENVPGLSYWTDYLVRDDTDWLLVSDHGGSVPAEDTMNQEKRSSNRIDYIEIPVADVQAAKKFYGEVFGWEFVDYGPDYASFNDGRLDGGLRKDDGGGQGGPLVVFYDAGLEEKVAKIGTSGGQIVKEIFDFPGGRRFHFLDPDGNEFAIWSDK